MEDSDNFCTLSTLFFKGVTTHLGDDDDHDDKENITHLTFKGSSSLIFPEKDMEFYDLTILFITQNLSRLRCGNSLLRNP